MERIFKYKIDKEYDNYTILAFLKAKSYPRGVIVTLKKTTEGILLNGKWAYVNEKLTVNDSLIIHLIENESSDIEPVNIPLDIVYEDQDIMVINKPADMPVHPSMGNHGNCLANALAYYFNSQNIPFVFRCINRLDRDTTGLTIIAKHSLSGGILSNAVSKREIKRTYTALCHGEIKEKLIIDAPIARKNDSTIERCVDFDKGEKAITNVTPLKYIRDKDLSLVELSLETGRTHQIRVHMAYIGHPLPGDFLYNPDYTYIKRQALHSSRLVFKHPVTGEVLDFKADLPADMSSLI